MKSINGQPQTIIIKTIGVNGTPMICTIEPCLDYKNRLDLHVEFWDERHTGQFISNYYGSTLIEYNDNRGINLFGGIPDWQISAENLAPIIDQIKKCFTKPE